MTYPILELPRNVEAEEVLLGSVLIDPAIFVEVAGAIKADDFYTVKHGWVWDVFAALDRRHDPIDLFTVGQELAKRGQLVELGGEAYLTRLVSLTANPYNASAYGERVAEASGRRALIRSASEIAKLAYDNGSDIDTVREEAHKSLSAAMRGGAAKAAGAGQAASDLYDLSRRRADHPEDFRRMSTGFLDVDALLGGGLRSDYALMIAGEAGKGKTILMAQMAVNLAAAGWPGVVFSIEMKREYLMTRIASWKTGIESDAIESGQMTPEQWKTFTEFSEWFSGLPLWIDDRPRMDTLTVRSVMAEKQAAAGAAWYALDYMRLLRDAPKADKNERDQIISSGLRQGVCRELGVTGIIIHTLNKDGMKASGGGLARLAGASEVTYDMDGVMFIDEHIPDDDEQRNPNLRTIYMPKTRFSRSGGLRHLVMDQRLPCLRDAETRTVVLDTAPSHRKNGRHAAEMADVYRG